jgi:bacterioferritin
VLHEIWELPGQLTGPNHIVQGIDGKSTTRSGVGNMPNWAVWRWLHRTAIVLRADDDRATFATVRRVTTPRAHGTTDPADVPFQANDDNPDSPRGRLGEPELSAGSGSSTEHRVAAQHGRRRGLPPRRRRGHAVSSGRTYADGMADFLTDVVTLRERARAEIEKGPITEAYGADRERVIQVLNEALATEIVCWMRYKRHYFTAKGSPAAEPIAAELLVHANEELAHSDLLATRIVQLQGEPNYNPDGLLARSHAEYDESHDLRDMLREDLVAERVAIASYTEIIKWLGTDDSSTRRIFEDILAQEEEHADDLLGFLEDLEGR